MQEPFDLELNGIAYAVFPETEEIYTIFKNGKEHLQMQRDEGSVWIKLDPQTELPVFDEDAEVNALGKEIDAFEGKGNPD